MAVDGAAREGAVRPSELAQRWRRLPRPLRIAAAALLIALGALGLVLPVLQGLLFLGAGLSLLAADVPAANRLRRRLVERWRQMRPAGQPDRVRVDPPTGRR